MGRILCSTEIIKLVFINGRNCFLRMNKHGKIKMTCADINWNGNLIGKRYLVFETSGKLLHKNPDLYPHNKWSKFLDPATKNCWNMRYFQYYTGVFWNRPCCRIRICNSELPIRDSYYFNKDSKKFHKRFNTLVVYFRKSNALLPF